MSSEKWRCGCFTAVPSMMDPHPAEPLQETKYKAHNLVAKQCVAPSTCASISTQAFPRADRSLNQQALCNMVQSMSLKRWDNKVRQGGGNSRERAWRCINVTQALACLLKPCKESPKPISIIILIEIVHHSVISGLSPPGWGIRPKHYPTKAIVPGDVSLFQFIDGVD